MQNGEITKIVHEANQRYTSMNALYVKLVDLVKSKGVLTINTLNVKTHELQIKMNILPTFRIVAKFFVSIIVLFIF